MMCQGLLPLLCLGTFSLALLAGLGCLDRLATPSKPDLPPTDNWGDDSSKASSSDAIDPAKLSVSNATLNDLKSRLRAFKGVEPVEGAAFDYGFNGRFMQKLVAYWLDQYNWRESEKRLNSFPSFYTRIEGLRVHFFHVKPKGAKKTLPLLLLHGWPGTVFEFHKLLPALTTPDADGLAFEVVAPSIPGFAWSEAPKKRGFGPTICARMFHKLMSRLGYQKYYLHGEDWGSIIGHVMDVEFEDHLLGFHTNTPVQSFQQPSILLQSLLGAFLPDGLLFDKLDNEKLYPFFEKLNGLIRESGYLHLQSTRPDTLGHALSDSPVGLAAYVLEKYSVWTNPENRFAEDGNLHGKNSAFSWDDLLTTVMIYWTTGSITSSMRLYKEGNSDGMNASLVYPAIPSQVPYGVVSLRYDLMRVPQRFIRVTHPNLLRFSDIDTGGHFAALQLPRLVDSEIRQFVRLAEAFHREKVGQTAKKAEL